MSKAAADTVIPRSPPVREPRRLQVVEALFSVAVVGLLTAEIARDPGNIVKHQPELLAWLLVVIVTDLLPVPLWGNLLLSLSLPVLLASAMVYPPFIAGTLAFVGSNDPREFRHEVTALHGLYNRSQIAASTLVASAVFHWAGGDIEIWPHALGLALVAVIADMTVNFSMVVLARKLFRPEQTLEVLRDFYGSEPLGFLASYLALGLVALLLGAVFSIGGSWGTLAFVLPVFLGRQVFVQSRRLRELADRVAEKTRLLVTLSERIAEERRDERLTIAAGLHDEVLPPLYKVHLMGQVIRRDLDNGQLLALEGDVPDLLQAADAASDAMRMLIRDLRHSPMGPGGLAATLRLLIQSLEQDTSIDLHLEISSVAGSPLVQLLAYQVIREATKNAIRHSGAVNVWVSLGVTDSDLRITVRDDGVGFDAASVDRDKHFGLQIMKERVELAGGVFLLSSERGEGCLVVARFPSNISVE